MENKLSDDAVAALMATAELCGTSLSKAAGALMMSDLSAYPEPVLIASLARCRREVKGRLTLADIIERISDGRPTAEEAWAQVGTTDESRTLVSTSEAMRAFGEVSALMEDDPVAARMAFRDAYKRIVNVNRERGVPPEWTASLGWDKEQRQIVLSEAVGKGLLDAAHAERVFGVLPPSVQLPAAQETKRLPAGDPKRIAAEQQECNLRGLADLKAALAGGMDLDAPRPKSATYSKKRCERLRRSTVREVYASMTAAEANERSRDHTRQREASDV